MQYASIYRPIIMFSSDDKFMNIHSTTYNASKYIQRVNRNLPHKLIAAD